ncbi:MAG: hypothetical protein K2Z81_03835 [Cyanobacteria bacterium]|nr:hypothetical protein [Cyanobacteriota bacterium]
MNTAETLLPDLFIFDQSCFENSPKQETAAEPAWYCQVEQQLSRDARMEQTNEFLKANLNDSSSDSIDLAMALKEMIGNRSGLGKLSYLVKATLSTKQ